MKELRRCNINFDPDENWAGHFSKLRIDLANISTLFFPFVDLTTDQRLFYQNLMLNLHMC